MLGEIVETLRKATGDLPEGEQLFAGVWRTSDGVGYQSVFNPGGLDEALAYLGCY